MKRDEIPSPMPGHQKASAAVSAALGTLPYPISREEAIARVGDWQIPYGKGVAVPLGEILRGVPAEAFDDAAQASVAVDRHWGRIAKTLRDAQRQERREGRRGRR